MDVLAGISLGLLADGEINSREAAFLKEWIGRNGETLPDFIKLRMCPILGILQESEIVSLDTLEELSDALMSLVGLDPKKAQINNKNLLRTSGLPSKLIFDNPNKPVMFSGHEVVITGIFSNTSRRDVIKRLLSLEAIPKESMPTLRTKYVLVGGKGSSEWSTTQLGNKIQRALELRANGCDILIIPESYLPDE